MKKNLEHNFVKASMDRIFEQIPDEYNLTVERVTWELKRIFAFDISVMRSKDSLSVNYKIDGEIHSILFDLGK